MATIVSLNLRVANAITGTYNMPDANFYDPLTGVNLNPGNLTSGDISGFSNDQLANIVQAVSRGILTLVTGSLPSDPNTYNGYGLYSQQGSLPMTPGAGITGVAADNF